MRKKSPAILPLLLTSYLLLSSSLYAYQVAAQIPTSSLQAAGQVSPGQIVVNLVNGTQTFYYDLSLETIALSYPAFRAAGSVGANETAYWIKEKFESFALDSWLEPFQFYNWTLLSRPSLLIDLDGNKSTSADQTVTSSFLPEHYSWPTPPGGVFADLVVLPLPPASSRGEIGAYPIDTVAWNGINTTGKIVLIGREVRWVYAWESAFVTKITAQTPVAVVYTWWYSWMSSSPILQSSGGGRPQISGYPGAYYWNLEIPVGSVNYKEGLWIRQQEQSTNVSAQLSLESVIGYGTHYNVVARIVGHENPEKIVIISSHYDTVLCSGFCDNGAGTAGVMELARVSAWATANGFFSPRYTLLFVAFTAEELGLVGSANFVKQHESSMSSIVAVINLDCIGSDDLRVTGTGAGPQFSLDQVVLRAASDLGISASTTMQGGSDQESFRIPYGINGFIYSLWGVDLTIASAQPVVSSTMIISYPLYSDQREVGPPGWIHTSYDNSTSTPRLSWIEISDLENHVKVATLTMVRISSSDVTDYFSLAAIAGPLILSTLCLSYVAIRYLNKRKSASQRAAREMEVHEILKLQPEA